MTTVISYGGGVQSTALIVLAAQGVIHADAALFANVGDDSEHPATLTYVRDIATPWAADRGLTIHEVRRRPTSTKKIDLRATMMDHDRLSLNEPIPVYALQHWLTDHHMVPAVSLIGISTDELSRAHNRPGDDGFTRAYPLLELGYDRSRCKEVIRDAGLPVPPKSACYFCPYHRTRVWEELRRDEPALFAKAQELEDTLNARRDAMNAAGRDFTHVYLTRFGRRLTDAIGEAQPALFDVTDLDNPTDIGEDGCDEGVCFV